MSEPPNQPPQDRPAPGYGPAYGQPGLEYGQPAYGPAYGQPEYGPADPYAQYPAPAPAGEPFLGERALRRPQVRVGGSLAGAGAALAVLGAFVWGVGYIADGFALAFADDDSGTGGVSGQGRRFLGFGLLLALTLVGYVVLVLRRHGPLATAATVLTVAGPPLALGFVTFDFESTFRFGDFPINVDLTLLGSAILWLVTYLLVPGGRGRAVYLGAAALALPVYASFKIAGEDALRTAFRGFDTGFTGSDLQSHSTAVGGVSLAFGLVYYAVAFLLDRGGRAGAAVALLFPAALVTLTGIVTLADDLEQVGTGVVLLLLGVVLTIYGGWFGRRFTAWTWAAAAMLGLAFVVTKPRVINDHYWAVGLVLVILGLVFAGLGQLLSAGLRERSELAER